jgi:hypothetical protein
MHVKVVGKHKKFKTFESPIYIYIYIYITFAEIRFDVFCFNYRGLNSVDCSYLELITKYLNVQTFGTTLSKFSTLAEEYNTEKRREASVRRVFRRPSSPMFVLSNI